ncbi:MAG: sugar phosphate nucleotidyltransferase [Armatimonadota bacterium]|nr:sugar phosphate nucleotidyltransferase [Armatimonadota bacterium]
MEFELSSAQHVKKAVIPAAGLGTRLRPLTLSQPKEMVACGHLPVIGYVLQELKEAGITEILLISRRNKPSLEDYVLDGWPGSFVIRQPEQKGLGHAVSLAEGWVGADPFVVALGDTIIQANGPVSPLQRLIASRPAEGCSMVLVREVSPERMSRYGVVNPWQTARPGEPFALRGIIEKPSIEAAPSNLAIAGRYVFTPAIFSALSAITAAEGGEIQLTSAMEQLCGEPGSLYASSLLPGERRFDIGSLDSYFEAFITLSAVERTDT